MSQLFLFGDSIVKGIVYDNQTGRYSIQNSNLINEISIIGFSNIFNLSKMGATISYVKTFIEKNLYRITKDDYVLIGCGGNDCDYSWNEVSDAPSVEHSPRTSADTFCHLFSECIQSLKKVTSHILLTNLVPIDSNKYMSFISHGRNYASILSWLGDSQILYRWQESYNHLVEKVADANHCDLIDVRTPFQVSHHYDNLFCPDGIHPSAEGYQIYNHTLVSQLKKLCE